MISYKSTRGGSGSISAAQAVIKGIAEDKGLYVPDAVPALPFKPAEMTGSSYREISAAVIGSFFTDYTPDEIKLCVDRAYDSKFDTEEIVPLVHAGGAYFLELYHGRTSAFKDMALSILPHLLTTAVKKENENSRIAILTATSGDTGKAALEGFADVDGTEIIVFYPSEGVSEVQKRQMTTQTGSNTHVFGIKGNFDDAQTGVKRVFNDAAFAEKLAGRGYRLSSANSINIGRLVPQIAYYVYAYIRLIADGVIKDGDKVNIVVPTGNFGNILAAYYTGRMGIPVNRFVCASNKNKVLTDFINTGVYSVKRDFYVTNSPSMDILISSNLERLLYHLSGDDSSQISRLMSELDEKGEYTVSDNIRSGMKQFYGGFADEQQTLNAIADIYSSDNYLIDTHTAVAYNVYRDYTADTGDSGTPAIIASTASAFKFAASVASALSMAPEANGFASVRALSEKTGVKVPEGLRDLDKKKILHTDIIEKGGIEEAVDRSLK